MTDILAVLSWWCLIQLIGLAAWPLAFRLLRFLPDRGYTAAKPLGLLLTSYVLWLLGSLGLVSNSLGGINMKRDTFGMRDCSNLFNGLHNARLIIDPLHGEHISFRHQDCL